MHRVFVLSCAAAAAASAFPLAPCTEQGLFNGAMLTQVSPDNVVVNYTSLRFFALGDYGVDTQSAAGADYNADFNVFNRNSTADTMQRMTNPVVTSARTPDFVVNAGDNFYQKGIQSSRDPRWNTTFESVFTQPADVYWYSVLGNHDWYGNQNSTEAGTLSQVQYTHDNAFNRWCMPAFNYTLHVDVLGSGRGDNFTVDFVFIDTMSMLLSNKGGCRATTDGAVNRSLTYCQGPNVPVFAEQQAWLRQQTCGSAASRKIVVGHHPLVSAGPYLTGGDPLFTAETVDAMVGVNGTLRSSLLGFAYNAAYRNATMHDALTALLIECGVDLYISGHEHITQVLKYTDSISGKSLLQTSFGDNGKANVEDERKTEPTSTACQVTGQCFANNTVLQRAWGTEWELLFKDNNGAFADVLLTKQSLRVDAVSNAGIVIFTVSDPPNAAPGSESSGSDDYKNPFIGTTVALGIALAITAYVLYKNNSRKGYPSGTYHVQD